MSQFASIKTDGSGRLSSWLEGGNTEVTVTRGEDGRPLYATAKNYGNPQYRMVEFLYGAGGQFIGTTDKQAPQNPFQSALLPTLIGEACGAVAASVDVATAVTAALPGIVATMLPAVANQYMLGAFAEFSAQRIQGEVDARLAGAVSTGLDQALPGAVDAEVARALPTAIGSALSAALPGAVSEATEAGLAAALPEAVENAVAVEIALVLPGAVAAAVHQALNP